MTKQRELLFRLVKDGRVVGYEKHESGKIWHANKYEFEQDRYFSISAKEYDQYYTKLLWHDIKKGCSLCVVCSDHYISHDRKDQYTGIDIDGVKIFENDEFITENDYKGYIIFEDAAFVAFVPAQKDYDYSSKELLPAAVLMSIKLIGRKAGEIN